MIFEIYKINLIITDFIFYNSEILKLKILFQVFKEMIILPGKYKRPEMVREKLKIDIIFENRFIILVLKYYEMYFY